MANRESERDVVGYRVCHNGVAIIQVHPFLHPSAKPALRDGEEWAYAPPPTTPMKLASPAPIMMVLAGLLSSPLRPILHI